MHPGKVSVTTPSYANETIQKVQKAMSSGRLRNDRSDCASLTTGGRLFQARAAATGNARSPSVGRLEGLTTRVGESADRTEVKRLPDSRQKANADNTCIAPQVTHRDFRGAGTTQARADVQPIQAVGQARRHGLVAQPNNHKHSPSLPFNGLHPRNPCNYIDHYSFTEPEGMEG